MIKTSTQVLEILENADFYPNKLMKSKGNFVYMKAFFYTNGNSAQKIADSLVKHFPNIKIIATADVWKAFRGGSPVEKQSHFRITFTMD